MSQYTFNVSSSGKMFIAVAGFCAKTATFFACVCNANKPEFMVSQSCRFRSDSEVLEHFDKLGLNVPSEVEEALLSDLELWEFGDASLKTFSRRVKHFD